MKKKKKNQTNLLINVKYRSKFLGNYLLFSFVSMEYTDTHTTSWLFPSKIYLDEKYGVTQR